MLLPHVRQNTPPWEANMAVSARHRQPQTCTNCDRPAPELAPLVRFSRRGDRIVLRVFRFCYLQLVPGTKLKRLPV